MPCLRHASKGRGGGTGPPPSPYASSRSSSTSVNRDTTTGTSSEHHSPSRDQPKSSKKQAQSQSHARKREAGYIKRPSNAFILFRTDFVAKGRIPSSIESHSQNLSRIAGEVWRSLSSEEKDPWMRKAQEVKEEHRRMFPGYAYHPTESQALQGKRKVLKGRGERELREAKRKCKVVAELVKVGTKGEALEKALMVNKLRDVEGLENEKRVKESRTSALPEEDEHETSKMDFWPVSDGVCPSPVENKHPRAMRQKKYYQEVAGCWEELRLPFHQLEDDLCPGDPAKKHGLKLRWPPSLKRENDSKAAAAGSDLESDTVNTDSDSSLTCSRGNTDYLTIEETERVRSNDVSTPSSASDPALKSISESESASLESAGYTFKSFGVPVLVLPNTYIPPGHSLNEYLSGDPYGLGKSQAGGRGRNAERDWDIESDETYKETDTEKKKSIGLPPLASVMSFYKSLDWGPENASVTMSSSEEEGTKSEWCGSKKKSIPTSRTRKFPGALRVPEKPRLYSCSAARSSIDDDPPWDADSSKSAPNAPTRSCSAAHASPEPSSFLGRTFPLRSVENRSFAQDTSDKQAWNADTERWTLRQMHERSKGPNGITADLKNNCTRVLKGGSESDTRYSHVGGVGSP